VIRSSAKEFARRPHQNLISASAADVTALADLLSVENLENEVRQFLRQGRAA